MKKSTINHILSIDTGHLQPTLQGTGRLAILQLFLLPSLRSDAGDSEQLERNMESGTLHQ